MSIFFSSKQSETSRSARSTPVKKTTRLVSYIDPDEEEDADKTINENFEEEEQVSMMKISFPLSLTL